jgi:tetratricopeptide (TPR) repeat protein
MKKAGLKKAHILFRKKKFPEVIRYLEPQVFMHRENFNFFYLLGISCLYTGDYGGAHTYLKRAAQLKPEDSNTLLGLAAIHLRRNNTEEALRLWLEILESDPGNPTAKRGMQYVRKYAGKDSIPDIAAAGKEERFFPNPPPDTSKIVTLILIILIIGAAVFFSYPLIKRRMESPAPPREGVEAVREMQESGNIAAYEGEYRYFYTEEELDSILDTIATYFNNYRDNLVIRESNRLLLSNASETLKEKIRLLLDHVKEPDFASLKDNFTYSEVMGDPFLYRNCYVLWKGRISNVTGRDAPVRFDLLVGYHTGAVVEGIVGVRLPFAAELEPGHSYEVLARIALAEGNKVYLRGTALHRIIPKEEQNQ